ncbi:hypothetical protein L1887_43349 [Cichorium endivia]|nr:hypothetical protein L1887_43349 [Cichorium endivia]
MLQLHRQIMWMRVGQQNTALAAGFQRIQKGHGFWNQRLPEIVIKGEIEQRAVHIQQNGIYLLPGDIKMHKGELQPEETCATG